jgi:hypothetical protein
MVRAWEDSLRRTFPDRDFYVVLEEDYGPTVYAISKRDGWQQNAAD